MHEAIRAERCVVGVGGKEQTREWERGWNTGE